VTAVNEQKTLNIRAECYPYNPVAPACFRVEQFPP